MNLWPYVNITLANAWLMAALVTEKPYLILFAVISIVSAVVTRS